MNLKIFIIIILIPILGKSQKVLLEENVEADTIKTEYGRNYKNFKHFYFSAGLIVGDNLIGSEILYSSSHMANFGYRYKRKLNNFYALGLDLSINNLSYYLKQDNNKTLPNDSLHYSEKIAFNSLNFEFYNRFNFGKRGNIIGKFVDIGIYTSFHYRSKLVTKDKLANSNNFLASKKKSVYTGLKYVENFGYGLQSRIGINRYVIFARMKLSSIFKSKYDFAELPIYVVGLQIGLH